MGDRYIKLQPKTVALLKELKGLRAFDRLTRNDELVLSQSLYNQLDSRRGAGQSFDDLIRRLITIQQRELSEK